VLLSLERRKNAEARQKGVIQGVIGLAKGMSALASIIPAIMMMAKDINVNRTIVLKFITLSP